MSWHDHVATIAKTASQKLGVLFRCRKLYTPGQLLLLYKAQIRPSLEYCSHVWDCAPKHPLKLLNSIQNRAAVRRRNTRETLRAHPYQVEVPTPRTSLLRHSFFWETLTLWKNCRRVCYSTAITYRALSGIETAETVQLVHEAEVDSVSTVPEDTPHNLNNLSQQNNLDFLVARPKLANSAAQPLHEELLVRWISYLQTGLEKEERDRIIEKYPLFENRPLMKTPLLVPEVASCLDKFVYKLQDQTGHALAA
nr:unnamed protein product [Callosobruchus analis]